MQQRCHIKIFFLKILAFKIKPGFIFFIGFLSSYLFQNFQQLKFVATKNKQN